MTLPAVRSAMTMLALENVGEGDGTVVALDALDIAQEQIVVGNFAAVDAGKAHG